MKKFFVAFCLIALCTVSFVGCNPPKQGAEEATPTATSADEASAADAPAADAPAEEAK